MSHANILVTGATGLVGSHLLYQLVNDGHRVKALVRETGNLNDVRQVFSFYGDGKAMLVDKVEWVEGDVTDYFSLLDALQNIDHVYHVAAYVSFNPVHRAQMYRINEEGTANVVNACIEQEVKKLCYVSSIATLGGSVNGLPSDEMSAWQAQESHSHYSKSKFLAEMEVWRGTKEGLPAVVVNPGVILGPGNPQRSSGKLFSLGQKGSRFYTSGGTGYVDVRDVVSAMIMLMNSSVQDERYVLVSENLSFRHILNLMAQHFCVTQPSRLASPFITSLAWRLDALRALLTGSEPRFTRENARTSHNTSHYSSEKFIRQFNYRFIPVTQSIADTIAWIKQEKE
jgi:nucleoside-diphosphate-sugar epimerase